jgi:hypothetical protein
MNTLLTRSFAVLACFTVVLCLGCAHPDRESDLPWNTPQAWEGSPMIPGLDGR